MSPVKSPLHPSSSERCVHLLSHDSSTGTLSVADRSHSYPAESQVYQCACRQCPSSARWPYLAPSPLSAASSSAWALLLTWSRILGPTPPSHRPGSCGLELITTCDSSVHGILLWGNGNCFLAAPTQAGIEGWILPAACMGWLKPAASFPMAKLLMQMSKSQLGGTRSL